MAICGRLTAEFEADGVWLYGVNPGALSVSAPTLAETSPAVTAALSSLFVDFAADFTTFDGFKAEVERFFHETDDETVAEWKAAVAAVRTGALAAPPGLEVKSADADLFVSITNRPISQVTPDDNPIVIAERQKQARHALAAAA